MIAKIDTHLHLAAGQEGQSIGQSLILSDALRLYDILNIERGIILSGSLPGAISNAEARELCKRYPERFDWFCFTSLRDGVDAALREVRDAREQGALGVGEFIDNIPLNSPEMDTLLKCCEDMGMPFMFHMSVAIGHGYGIVDDEGLPALERALMQFPQLKIIGHSPAFWCEIAADVSLRVGYPFGRVEREGRLAYLFRKYPNLYGDLSANSASNALMRDPEYGVSFLEEFQDRLFFATDSLFCPLGPWLDLLSLQDALSQTAYEKICRGNAARFILR